VASRPVAIERQFSVVDTAGRRTEVSGVLPERLSSMEDPGPSWRDWVVVLYAPDGSRDLTLLVRNPEPRNGPVRLAAGAFPAQLPRTLRQAKALLPGRGDPATIRTVKEVAGLLNGIREASVVTDYALFGAAAQMRYTEAVATLDADVLVVVPEPDRLVVSEPIYA
jgi:hypothetical protein